MNKKDTILVVLVVMLTGSSGCMATKNALGEKPSVLGGTDANWAMIKYGPPLQVKSPDGYIRANSDWVIFVDKSLAVFDLPLSFLGDIAWLPMVGIRKLFWL